jgi:hypothetical protein
MLGSVAHPSARETPYPSSSMSPTSTIAARPPWHPAKSASGSGIPADRKQQQHHPQLGEGTNRLGSWMRGHGVRGRPPFRPGGTPR